ncbi:MAG TPA: uracil-DNA glycosylase [Candidatus Cloacimonadota bacterium]|jgi:DNA polymerase|nr:MAG: Uracil DNA glycosylase superfamily protein [Candidatus Cloacimonetes bacterium ADurb.Bin088]HOC94613.1 uracil-DNA glycosylase [Candidatus Cloacimonadota bacterium]HPB08284.1 uracil-DNA glycosylase [Candidatus Cloacimonadota bacterium]HQL12879.1 uracil-DNA glycosylase [Candidatus Cloacimonadota bacterium]HQP18034.1 uracil-DNA glycosylase [Candidatus Cloacimonadota bacterium]
MTLRALQQHLEMLQNSGIGEIYREAKDKAALLAKLKLQHSTCTLCPLHEGRIKFVYGEGNPDAIAMLIGEGPGEQENLSGRPFVGRAGDLLTKMLAAIEIKREDVYICNIVKCRPPGNRNPENPEREACLPYLLEQIEIIQPKLIMMLGLVAAQTLLQTRQPMQELHTVTHEFMGIPSYVTYHPASLLRNERFKYPAWDDLKRFRLDYDRYRS